MCIQYNGKRAADKVSLMFWWKTRCWRQTFAGSALAACAELNSERVFKSIVSHTQIILMRQDGVQSLMTTPLLPITELEMEGVWLTNSVVCFLLIQPGCKFN